MSHVDHKATSPASVRCYVLTISDTRHALNDTSGLAISELLEGDGHDVSGRAIVRDDPDAIRAALMEQLDASTAEIFLSRARLPKPFSLRYVACLIAQGR